MHNLNNHIIPCLHFLIMIGLPLPIITRARIKNDQILWHRYVGHQHVRKFGPVVNFRDCLFSLLTLDPSAITELGSSHIRRLFNLATGNWSLLPIPRHSPLEIRCSMVGVESRGKTELLMESSWEGVELELKCWDLCVQVDC